MLNPTKLTVILLVITGAIVLAGCGTTYNAPAGIVGEWTCHDFASDESTDTSFYALHVQEDGTFRLDDRVSGNPAVSGKMYGDDTGNLGIINIECDETHFDPPVCWKIGREARLRYKVIDQDTIKLGYTGVWLSFDRAK